MPRAGIRVCLFNLHPASFDFSKVDGFKVLSLGYPVSTHAFITSCSLFRENPVLQEPIFSAWEESGRHGSV